MRIDVNLASLPYEDVRRFWMRWGTAVAVAGIITLALVSETAMGWYYARQDHQLLDQLRAQISKRDQEKALAQDFLNRPENRSIRDRSQFLNFLIQRKAFSWTQVFQDLEKVMPARLHVVSIRPELSADNQLQIKLVVAGDSPDRALELVRHMEDSPRFHQPALISQSTQTNSQTPGDNVESSITALYMPGEPEATTAEARP